MVLLIVDMVSKSFKSLIYILVVLLLSILITNQNLGDIVAQDNVVQDDFRQSLFWMWSMWDPELFQGDFFTEMYHSHIYRVPLLHLIFRLAPFFTDSLIAYSKSIAYIASVLSSIFAYLFFRTFIAKDKEDISYKEHLYAIVFSVLLTTTIWCTDHVSAAQARSFVWAGLCAYMYYKLLGKDLAAIITTFILLLLSPITFLLCIGMEFYLGIIKHGLGLISVKLLEFQGLIFNALATCFLYLFVFRDIKTQGVGESFTVAEMKALPEFNPGGRHPIFGSSIWDGSWWSNEHWGLGVGYLPISKIIVWAAILLGIYLVYRFVVNKDGLLEDFKRYTSMPPAALLYSGLSLYIAAQVIFPVLYLPSRYIGVPLLLLSLIVIALAMIPIVDRFEASFNLDDKGSPFKPAHLKFLIALITLFAASMYWAYFSQYYHARFVSIHPKIQEVIERVPKDALIAGHPLLPDLNTASITCKRMVYVDYERSMAYTKESLAEIRRRNQVSLAMVYAKTKEEFIKLAQENGITHFLANGSFYTPQYLSDPVYIKPYDALLRKLVMKAEDEVFYLQEYLASMETNYIFIDIAAL